MFCFKKNFFLHRYSKYVYLPMSFQHHDLSLLQLLLCSWYQLFLCQFLSSANELFLKGSSIQVGCTSYPTDRQNISDQKSVQIRIFFLVRIFLYSVQILKNTDQKKIRIWTHFTQCIFQTFSFAATVYPLIKVRLWPFKKN